MEYEVEREPGQWHIQEKGQTSRGTTVTDSWLASLGFSAPNRGNIQAIVDAVYAMKGGVTLDKYAASHMPKDIPFTPGSKHYPSHPLKGRVARNPPGLGNAQRKRSRMQVPERMMIRG